MNDRLFLIINAGTHPSAAAVMLAMAVSRVLPVVLMGGTAITALVRRWRIAVYRDHLACLLGGLSLAGVVSWVLGRMFYLPRPFTIPLGVSLIHHADNSTFPSNHVLFMTVYAVFFLLVGRLRLAGAFGLATTAMAWSRVYLGVHFPLDTAGAALIGAASAVTAWWIWRSGRDGDR